MKKFLYFLLTGLFLIVVVEVGLYFYLSYKSQQKAEEALILSSPSLGKQVEIVSRLDKINILEKSEPLKELLAEWKIWEEGVYTRDFERALEIRKSPPRKIKIIFTYDTYPRDKVFSKGELISSAKEERIDSELTIFLGFSKKFLDTLNKQKKERYLTQSFITTLYRISHTEQDFEKKEEELKRILIEFLKTNKTIFEIK